MTALSRSIRLGKSVIGSGDVWADYDCGPGQNTKCLFLLDCQSDKWLSDQATCLMGKTFSNLELKTIKSCYRDI